MKKYKKIYIEITNVCNLACGFCPKTKRPAEFMGRALFEEILQKIGRNSTYLYFHVMGEPLLHPELGAFLDLGRQYGYRVNITTNGTLIGETGETLISAPALRQVNFSLHSFEANTPDGSMEDYLDGIFRFICRAREKNGLSICLRLWNTSENGMNRENRHILQRIKEEFGLEQPLENTLTPCNGIKLADHVFLNQAAVFDWPDSEGEETGDTGYCYGLMDQLAILVDGTVVPCCLDSEGTVNLGNIKEQTLEEILRGERARSIFGGFSRRKVVEPLCRRCGFRKRFDG